MASNSKHRTNEIYSENEKTKNKFSKTTRRKCRLK